MSKMELLAREAAAKHGLDPALVCALCEVESSWNPWAVRHEPRYRWLWALTYEDYPMEPHFQSEELHLPGYTAITEQILQRTSWGLMQIMGAVARERGFRDWLTGLCDPAVNLEWGCRHLRWMLDHPLDYGLSITQGPAVLKGTLADLAAAWNGGKVRYSKCQTCGGGGAVIYDPSMGAGELCPDCDSTYVNQSYVDRAVKAMVNYE